MSTTQANDVQPVIACIFKYLLILFRQREIDRLILIVILIYIRCGEP